MGSLYLCVCVCVCACLYVCNVYMYVDSVIPVIRKHLLLFLNQSGLSDSDSPMGSTGRRSA